MPSTRDTPSVDPRPPSGFAEEWSFGGGRIADARLRDRLGGGLADAGAALGRAAGRTPTRIDAALALLDAAEAELAAVRGTPETARVRVALRELHGDVREHSIRQRTLAFTGIQRGLARLRGLRTTAGLLSAAPSVIGETLGFDRVIVSQVEDGMWRPVKIYVRDDERWADEILAASAEPEPLAHLLVESDMARRRAPLLVHDVENTEQFHRRIVQASNARSYVAAPIMPEGNVIGFLHADYFMTRRHPDELDRDILFAFAEAFGAVFERTALAERLQSQAEQVRAMTASLEVVLADAQETELRMAAAGPTGEDAVRPRRRAPDASGSRLAGLLTARELEVAQLLATGATNAEIASQLVVAEGTVKSHVKHILRKLHATNRAEVVSKYLRLAALPEHRQTT